jgi:septal ring factor EnvC (AmiA/AmiB activator)
MGDVRDSDAVNRRVAEHVERLRRQLAAGRDEIARQREAAANTQRHIEEVHRWLAETERQLQDARDRDGEAA